MSISSQSFSRLPLDQQIRILEDPITEGPLTQEPVAELLEVAAGCADHAPLAWLVTALMERGWLRHEGHRALLARFLLRQGQTAVHQVLRRLLTSTSIGGALQEQVCELLLDALRLVGLPQLSTMCLLDRALKHHFPARRDAYVASLRQRAEELFAAGGEAELPLSLLAQLSGRDIPALRDVARRHGALQRFDSRRGALATEAMEALARAPKAVSQTNAEELLARRVYTDPGHFLIELLQNAEDSGAVCWAVTFEAERIVVWHDGAPFDARDLVGVTSIGQTTKRKSQIGFFGVGFKAVYEVTSRPQIYSDVYNFEIADVSIPKRLAERPPELPQEGTVLVLPLREVDNELRSPAALYDKARALDPCVLFTLEGIDVLELRLDVGAAGSPAEFRVHESPPDGRRASLLHIESKDGSGQVDVRDERYGVYDHRLRYEGARAAGRPDETTIMVGLRLDADALPIALPPTAPTIYSYLPTAEQTGLRFFVQAHFDVPVDRERITATSEWNRWVLARVPQQLARAASELCADEARAPRAFRLLDVLPLRAELRGEFATICDGLPEAFAEVPLLPCRDGAMHPPPRCVLAPPSMAALLGGGELPGRVLWPHRPPNQQGGGVVMAPLDDARREAVALELGAVALELPTFIEVLRALLTPEAPEGAPLAACRRGELEALTQLHRVLLEHLAVSDEDRPEALRLRLRLRSLPLLVDDGGQLVSPKDCVRGTRAFRAIYKGRRRLLGAELDPALGGADDEANDERAALLALLGVRELGFPDLFGDLERALSTFPHPEGPIDDLAPGGFPASAEQRRAIFELLAEAPAAMLTRAARLPLFRGTDGRYHRLARSRADEGAAVAYLHRPLAKELAEFYEPLRPVIVVDADHEDAQVLSQLQVVVLDVELFLADLSRDADAIVARDERLWALHELLEVLAPELGENARRQLARLPIWPDGEGRRRRLVGAEAALRCADAEVATFFPAAPFMAEALWGKPHVAQSGGRLVDASTLVEVLSSPEVHPSLSPPTGEPLLAAVCAYLAAHRDELSASARRALPHLPLFASEGGERLPLTALHRASPQIRALYGASSRRSFIAEEATSTALAEALGLSDKVRPVGIPELVEDLLALAPEIEGRVAAEAELPLLGAGLAQLRTLLLEQRESLARSELRRVTRLPLFADQCGRLGALAAHHEQRRELVRICVDEALVPVLAATGRRLLAAEELQLWAPLIEAAEVEPLEPAEIIEALAPAACAPRLVDAEARRAFYGWLLAKEAAVFSSVRCRQLLAEGRWLLNSLEELVTPQGMVGRASVGENLSLQRFTVADEVPEELLELLERHLGTGSVGLAHLEAALAQAAAGEVSGEVVAAVAREVFEGQGEALWSCPAFVDQPWASNSDGEPRPLRQLYRSSPELVEVVGERPELVVAPALAEALGTRLLAAAPLREIAELPLGLVLEHLLDQPPVLSFAPYEWLEEALAGGRVAAEELRGALADARWVFADEGCYFGAGQVCGEAAPGLFGEARGSWPRGLEACPRLCELFEIRPTVDSAFVVGFIDEVSRRAADVGAAELLAREPELVGRLLGCYERLGEALDREPPPALPQGSRRCLLCRDVEGRVGLASADQEGLHYSDTPTLQKLFQGAPGLSLALLDDDPAGARSRFYRAMGLRCLRESYEVRVLGGAVVDAAPGDEASGLLRRLESLAAVLPRVEKQRGGAPGQWCHGSFLAELRSASLRIVAPLLARYRLGEVASADAEIAALYERTSRLLYVEPRVVAEPAKHATALAMGLMPAIYQGPAEEQLIDIVALLLALPDEAAMSAYLDLRHYPQVASLHAAEQPEESDTSEEPADIAFRPSAPGEDLPPPSDVETTPSPPSSGVSELSTSPAREQFQASPMPRPELSGEEPPSPSEEAARLQAAMALLEERFARFERTSPRPEALLEEQEPSALRSAPQRPEDGTAVSAAPTLGSSAGRSARRPAQDAPRGFWRRVAAWFKGGSQQAPIARPGTRESSAGTIEASQQPLLDAPPTWSRGAANPFTPGHEIGPQLWMNRARREALARRAPLASLTFTPASLPRPHLYAVHGLGVRFDATKQRWLPPAIPSMPPLAETPLSGEVVHFHGSLPPGHSVMPAPLYGRAGELSVAGGAPLWRRGERLLGGLEVEHTSAEPLEVGYPVSLLRPPSLAEGARSTAPRLSPTFLEPTVPASTLPREVRRFLGASREMPLGWQRALAAQSFVREHYRYDADFLERGDVQRALRSAPRDSGNRHLLALHASGDGEILGRGICYELNLLVVELLRHLEVPAAAAVGWVLGGGRVGRPDHLFALAWLPAAEGLAVLPLDAAVSRQGQPLRPLSPLRTAEETAPAPAKGLWAGPRVAPGDTAVAELEREMRGADERRLQQEARELVRVLRLLDRRSALSSSEHQRWLLTNAHTEVLRGGELAERVTLLREVAASALGDSALVAAYLAAARGDFDGLEALPASVYALERRDLVTVGERASFVVRPALGQPEDRNST